MGSLRQAIGNWLLQKAENTYTGLRESYSTIVGDKYVMMTDDPKQYIEKGLVYNPDVASVIDYITKVALRVPWELKQGDTVIENHEIYDTFYAGNPVSRGSHVWANAIKQYLAAGNTYVRGIGPSNGVNAGKIREFWNLHYDMIIERGGSENPITGYRTRFSDKIYDASEVMHWKTANPDGDGYFGTSPLKAGRLVLQQSNDAYLANAKSLSNLGARGILTRRDLDHGGPEAAKRLKEEFAASAGGADKFGKLVIAGGEYEYINFALSPADLQLLDAQLRSRQAICNIYSFPSELLNDKEASTYNNLQTMLRKLYTDVEIPLLEDLADVLHEFWISRYGKDFSFRPNWKQVEVLQANRKELTEWLDRAWWIPAERKSEIMEEEPTLKGHYIPANYIPEGMNDVNTDDALKAYGLAKD